MRTIQQLAKEALDVQNACSSLGLTKGYAKAIQELADIMRETGGYSTDALNNHPINRLWASKMHDLANMGMSDTDRYHEADAVCQSLANLDV